MIEEWRAVVGWEGLYEVSSLGRVNSIERYTRGKGGSVFLLHGRILKTAPHPDGGYPTVTLSRDNVRRTKLVHILLMRAFVGPPPSGMQACHNNGNPEECFLSNLRYDTPAGNSSDMVKHGRSQRGEKHSMAKLSRDDVLWIRKMSGVMKQDDIAAKYGVRQTTISMIVTRQNWAWLEG